MKYRELAEKIGAFLGWDDSEKTEAENVILTGNVGWIMDELDGKLRMGEAERATNISGELFDYYCEKFWKI